MADLVGNYRSNGEKVNHKDEMLRERAIPILEKIFNYSLMSNPNVMGIDLLHKNRRGGIELEWGQWKGHYLKQMFESFNYFTIDNMTFQAPGRKEKYFRPKLNLISRKGKPYTHYEPDYQFNLFVRFNRDFTQFWCINTEMFLRENALVRGRWKTHTVTTGDIEDWLCFFRENVEIYNLIDGEWIKEDTEYIINHDSYKSYVDRYRREFHSRKNQESQNLLSEQIQNE